MTSKIKCILLIDDDNSTNFLHSAILQDADCALRIIAVNSAMRGLQFISRTLLSDNKSSQEVAPELIFLDLNMPIIDGWEFLEVYKNVGGKIINRPILIMGSSLWQAKDKIRALANPEVSGIYDKPLTNEIVTDILSKYFHSQTETNTYF